MNSALSVAQQYFDKALTPITSFEIGGLLFTPSYFHAIAIVILLFLLVLTFARLRRLYVDWSLKGSATMIGLGFLLAVIVEGFLILGGRTLFTQLVGWQNAPQPIQTALDAGRAKLVQVLGTSQEIPQSSASEPVTVEKVIGEYQSLSPDDAARFKKLLCVP
jgi:hypothetical protein